MIKSISIYTPNTYLLDITFRFLFTMAAKKYKSDRKRSRPVTSRKKTDVLKKNWLVTGFVFIIIVAVAIAGVYIFYTSNNENGNESGDQNNGSNGQDNEEGNPIAVFDTTLGTFKLELFEDEMPETCENFIRLVNDGFYTGLVFHRVANLIPDEPNTHVIQGGGFDTNGNNKESPYGPIDLEINPSVRHVDGAIAMARTSDPNSATSQFYICDGAHSFLDDNYAAFGVVTEGMTVVRTIANVDTTTKNGMSDWPVNDVTINSITIE